MNENNEYEIVHNYYLQADMLHETGEYENALSAISKALEMRPDEASFYDLRGLCQMHLGLYQNAIEAFDKAIYFESNHANAYNNRAIAKALLGRYDEALADFSYAAKFFKEFLKEYTIEPSRLAFWNDFMWMDTKAIFSFYNRGVTLMKQNKFEKAAVEFMTVISIDPQNLEAHHCLKSLQIVG